MEITLADAIRVESITVLGSHGLEILENGSMCIRHTKNILEPEEIVELDEDEAYRLYVSLHAHFQFKQ